MTDYQQSGFLELRGTVHAKAVREAAPVIHSRSLEDQSRSDSVRRRG